MNATETTVAKADGPLRGGAETPPRQPTRIFLPRPWLDVNSSDVLEREPLDASAQGADGPQCEYLHRAGAAVYVKGAVAQRGRETVRLAYWHQVATI